MKKVSLLLAAVLCLTLFTACGKSEKVYTAEDVAGRIYTYEKDGFGGPFTIQVYQDGTFQYYVGFLSSYVGMGEWTAEGGVLTLRDKTGLDYVNHFRIGDNMLTYLAEGSTGTMYLEMEDGDRFFGEPIPTLPTQEEIRELVFEENAAEEELAVLLQSFTCADMVALWGEPDSMTSGIWSCAWNLDETSAIWVVFDGDGCVSDVRLSLKE